MPDASRRLLPRSLCGLAVLMLLTAAHRPARADDPPRPAPKGVHPVVPAFERFFTGPKADAARGGQLLLGELSCTRCHRAESAAEAVLLPRQPPILDGVAARVRRSFLKKFLADPHGTKPGTLMPDVLAALPEQERSKKVEELVHFLASTGALKHERPEKKLILPGRELYHRVGCVACHGTRDAVGSTARKLPTTVPLGELKAKYSINSLAQFLQNPHVSRPAGRMPSLLDGKEARAVANYLLQGIAFKTPPPNVTYSYYEGSWDRLPDFAKLKPVAHGKATGFDLTLARRQNDMAMRFEGYLRIPRTGEYRFHLTSDDGSKLFLDDKLAVANDGIHPPSTVAQTVRLTKGVHKLVAAVFNAGGGVELQVDIEGSGLGRQHVGPLLMLTPEGNPKPPAVAEKNDDDFAIDPALAERGRTAFTTLGCASCHQLTSGGRPLASLLNARPLAKLGTEGGCLAAAPAKGLPVYSLTEAQRKALSAGIKSVAALPAAPPAVEVIARSFTALNCYACHQRGKVGGVEEAWNTQFTTTEPEMGDEGRIPPALDGVGAKLNPDYLLKVLTTGAHDRPYMHTRMPGFGPDHAARLARALESVDTLAPLPKVTFAQPLTRVKAQARRMVGAMPPDLGGADSLGCIKCHTFNKHKAEGIQGIDMTLMPKRVRREWFHRYVIDPQKFRPGTRMPSSWPNGQTFLTDVLGGDTNQQIEAIWVYLSDGGKAQLPLGMKKQFLALVPKKEAIIYRNFLEGVGARAIGVGYPEKAHLAFDANDLRLAMIWQGAFLDASRHWTDRGAGFEGPLGDNIVHLPAGVAFAVLDKEGAAWPKASARDLGYRFRGYRLTPDQRPTFLYSVGGVRVEDFPNAVAGKPASLQRTLTLSADQPVKGLWFRAAAGDKVEALGKGWYRINGEYRMRIDSTAAPVIRSSGGKQELLVPVRFENNRARIVQEIVW
jgi:mono/diheme cytochrome c family protein